MVCWRVIARREPIQDVIIPIQLPSKRPQSNIILISPDVSGPLLQYMVPLYWSLVLRGRVCCERCLDER